MENVKITDEFSQYYRNVVREKMLPYQWNVLNDAIDINIERERDDDCIPNEKSHAIENFKIAASRTQGHHYGWVFQDSDVYKWLEAAAYSLMEKLDEDLKKKADWVVDLISDAQEDDGYIGTYFTIEEPDRKFKRLSSSHELYCAGHFMEAAVAYYEAVGNDKVLNTACKLADCIYNNFGSGKGQINGYDGHEEVEIGLMRLYQTTKNKRYLDLCIFFLERRGRQPDFFKEQREADTGRQPIEGLEKFPPKYFQAHKPITEQSTAEGHAVRQIYLCTAMAMAAKETEDNDIWQACQKIFRNIVDRRMYITGGIGTTVHGEAFTLDYDLPNDTMYCETCASVGLIFFAYNMLLNETDSEYADIMERALYNTVLSGMALDGKHFFYVNPLEVVPEMSKNDPGKSHVKTVRPDWLGCACCPPNLARLIASLDRYAYVKKDNQVLSVLFMNCEADFEFEGGIFSVKQETEFPWEGKISYKLDYTGENEIEFLIRIPGWADGFKVILNGEPLDCKDKCENGFLKIKGSFSNDTISLEIPMNVEVWRVNEAVRSDIGLLAVSRGPFIYCLEEADNGKNLHLLSMEKMPEFNYKYVPDVLGGVGIIENDGFRKKITDDKLYRKVRADELFIEEQVRLKWIPYYSWANRGENEMRVFVRERSQK